MINEWAFPQDGSRNGQSKKPISLEGRSYVNSHDVLAEELHRQEIEFEEKNQFLWSRISDLRNCVIALTVSQILLAISQIFNCIT